MTTFQTPEAIAVTIDIAAGNVTVVASDRTDTVVEVKPSDAAKKADIRAAEQVRVDFADGALTVQTPKGWRSHSPFGSSSSIEVTVQVPTGSRLHATAALGRLVGSGALGESELEVSMGDILVERPQGSVTAKTAKGDIHIGEATRGVLRLETATGEIEVGINPASGVRLESSPPNGSVSNQLAPAGQAHDIVEVIARNSTGNIVIRTATVA